MGKYFGTDGFRGRAGTELTASHAFAIGRALGCYLGGESKHPRAMIGKDTRRSCYMLEYAVAAGLASAGADAYLLHVTTTASVSYLTPVYAADVGIMISASHNPYYDNGIKLLDAKGEKLPDGAIAEIEALLERDDLPFAEGERVGRIIDCAEARERYVSYLTSLAGESLSGMRIGIDAANGAAHKIAREVFEALGAEVVGIGEAPDGVNVNDGVGSTHPEALARLVKERGLDLGFAFDGDADRCIAVDERGEIVDGDAIMYILAKGMLSMGDRLVTTVMSNLGLYRALERIGIGYEITDVGDRQVYERMKEGGHVLGGEQSGHIIMSKYERTGDGLLSAIKLAEAVVRSGAGLSALYSELSFVPQLTLSVPVRDKGVICAETVAKSIEEARLRLGKKGRLLVRPSGTEPVIRITVEADGERLCSTTAKRLRRVIEEADANA